MDTEILIYALLFVCFCLALGTWSFFGKRATAYIPPFFSARLLLIGTLLLVTVCVSFFLTPVTDSNDYIISYIFFTLGIAFGIAAMTFGLSKRAITTWWRFTGREPGANDKQHLIAILLILAFGFFFSFFLFYPPFLSIG